MGTYVATVRFTDDIRKKMKIWRIQNSVSTNEVALKLEISVEWYRRLESGTGSPTTDLAVKVGQLMDISEIVQVFERVS